MNKIYYPVMVVSLVGAMALAQISCGSGPDSVPRGSIFRQALAVQWGYSGSTGPDHWADLDSSYKTCGEGQRQSPIDLTGKIYGVASTLRYFYLPSTGNVVNDGHTFVYSPSGASYITVDKKRFDLARVKFHAPSEHKFEGRQYPMEAQLIHLAADGSTAIISQVFARGAANPVMAGIWAGASAQEGVVAPVNGALDPWELLFWNKSFYSYEGSLNEPPCSEVVMWVVMKGIMTASDEQIAMLTNTFGPNARPAQPMNGRHPGFSRVD